MDSGMRVHEYRHLLAPLVASAHSSHSPYGIGGGGKGEGGEGGWVGKEPFSPLACMTTTSGTLPRLSI